MSKLLILLITLTTVKSLPIIRYFHGINDLCPSNNFDPHFPNHNIKCVKLNKGDFGSLSTQITDGCQELMKEEELLKKGFILIGISQGGLLARGILQRCPIGKFVRRFLSIGGPQNGIAISPEIKRIYFVNEIAYFLCYLFFRYLIVPCSYFKPVNHMKMYLESNVDLIDLNNEKFSNLNYKKRILNLEAFVNISFLQDDTVIPYNSGNFGFFKDNNYNSFIHFEDSEQFKSDLLGLKSLDDQGKFFKCEVEGGHIHLTEDVYRDLIFPFATTGNYDYLDKLDNIERFCKFKRL